LVMTAEIGSDSRFSKGRKPRALAAREIEYDGNEGST
jgi:hypothetical protein